MSGNKLCTIAGIFPILLSSSISLKADEPVTPQPRAWYILSQSDTSVLLKGLPQRLQQVNTPEHRQTAVWQGNLDGGQLRITIDADEDVDGEILVGFFADARWELAEPKQVRSFPGPGTYVIDNLIPGKFVLGAMVGSAEKFAKADISPPKGCGLGVHDTWPERIEIKPDTIAETRVLVSNKCYFSNGPVSASGSFGVWEKMDPTNLIMVRTHDPDGNPLPFCQVGVSQLLRNGPRIDRTYYLSTDALGRGYLDSVRGKYTLFVHVQDFIPDSLSQRFYGQNYSAVHDTSDPHVVELVVNPPPTGTAEISGRVQNQFGQPLREFYLRLSPQAEPDKKDSRAGLVTPFMSADGRYSVKNVAPGEYKVEIRHFDYPTHVYRQQDFPLVVVPETPNAAVLADFTVEAKELLYGQAFYDDGAPALYGVWSASFVKDAMGRTTGFGLGFDPSGKFRVCLSAKERQQVLENFAGLVKLTVYETPDRNGTPTKVQVHIDDLSKDTTKPARVVVPRMPSVNGQGSEK
jgi:hypothetical protein